MIDNSKLQAAYDIESFYSLQLEIGDRCCQGCIYCYMNAVPQGENTLNHLLIKNILKDSKEMGITAIEWLGGEPLLRKSVFEHMACAWDLGLRNNIWTGGLPFKNKNIVKNCARYAENGLISVHASTVNAQVYKNLHPRCPVSDLEVIINGVKELLHIGYPPGQILNSVTYTGMQTAEDMIETIDFFEEEFGIATSLNVYHTYLRPDMTMEQLNVFIPEPGDVHKVYKRYAKQQGRKRLPMNCVNKQYCSATVAVLCDGSVTPCATIRGKNAPNIHTDGGLLEIAHSNRGYLTFKEFKTNVNRPASCIKCNMNDECWGCRSRAYAVHKGVYGKDPRCFR